MILLVDSMDIESRQSGQYTVVVSYDNVNKVSKKITILNTVTTPAPTPHETRKLDLILEFSSVLNDF